MSIIQDTFGKHPIYGHDVYEHCNDNRTRVKQFCNDKDVKVRDIFGIYDIMQCDKDDSSYYEDRIYDLVKIYLPNITLINKNKPNRGKQESGQHWRTNNLEYIRKHNRKWRKENPDYRKKWREEHPKYFK